VAVFALANTRPGQMTSISHITGNLHVLSVRSLLCNLQKNIGLLLTSLAAIDCFCCVFGLD